MTNEELQSLTEEWSRESFGRPFTHRIVFNPRLRTTGGRYHLGDHHIDVNPLMLTEYDLKTLKEIVLHELCHYHLHLTGRGYRHRDRDFRLLLARVGGRRFAPPTSRGEQEAPGHRYRCRGCGQLVVRRRRFNPARYRCRQCGGSFTEI